MTGLVKSKYLKGPECKIDIIEFNIRVNSLLLNNIRPRKINYLFPLTALKKGVSVKHIYIYIFFTSINLERNLETMITIIGLLYCLYQLVT